MNSRRVLHVLGTADPAGLGVYRIVESLALRVDPARYEIHVCFLRPGELAERLRSQGIQSTCIDWCGRVVDPPGLMRYAALLRSTKFDIIHQHTGGRLITGMGRQLAGARIVRSLHGRASETTGVVTPNKLARYDALIANSQIVAEHARDANAVVIYPGIDVSQWIVPRPAHEGVVIGVACRLELIKGVEYLLKALALLASKFPEVRLEIAGDGSLRATLEQRSQELGLADKVRFLGWRNDLPEVMAGWDIVAMPSLDEGFGMAALDGMAAGLPVVATAVGGLRELIEDGITGRLVHPGKPDELAQRLRELIEDRGVHEAMGRAGRRRALDHFSIDQMVERTLTVYDELFV